MLLLSPCLIEKCYWSWTILTTVISKQLLYINKTRSHAQNINNKWISTTLQLLVAIIAFYVSCSHYQISHQTVCSVPPNCRKTVRRWSPGRMLIFLQLQRSQNLPSTTNISELATLKERRCARNYIKGVPVSFGQWQRWNFFLDLRIWEKNLITFRFNCII